MGRVREGTERSLDFRGEEGVRGSEGKKNQGVAGGVNGQGYGAGEGEEHLDQVGMLCSEQSLALAAPSSFHLWEVEQVTLS